MVDTIATTLHKPHLQVNVMAAGTVLVDQLFLAQQMQALVALVHREVSALLGVFAPSLALQDSFARERNSLNRLQFAPLVTTVLQVPPLLHLPIQYVLQEITALQPLLSQLPVLKGRFRQIEGTRTSLLVPLVWLERIATMKA